MLLNSGSAASTFALFLRFVHILHGLLGIAGEVHRAHVIDLMLRSILVALMVVALPLLIALRDLSSVRPIRGEGLLRDPLARLLHAIVQVDVALHCHLLVLRRQQLRR